MHILSHTTTAIKVKQRLIVNREDGIVKKKKVIEKKPGREERINRKQMR
jgi:hypothetical protein